MAQASDRNSAPRLERPSASYMDASFDAVRVKVPLEFSRSDAVTDRVEFQTNRTVVGCSCGRGCAGAGPDTGRAGHLGKLL